MWFAGRSSGLIVEELTLRDEQWAVSLDNIRIGEKKVGACSWPSVSPSHIVPVS